MLCQLLFRIWTFTLLFQNVQYSEREGARQVRDNGQFYGAVFCWNSSGYVFKIH